MPGKAWCGLADRASRPHHSPCRLVEAAVAGFLASRRQRLSGLALIRRFGRPLSTGGPPRAASQNAKADRFIQTFVDE